MGLAPPVPVEKPVSNTAVENRARVGGSGHDRPGRPTEAGFTCKPAGPSDAGRTLAGMEQPTRIDLLELDIDLRLADLWREASDISEWNLEVVAAFMRAAYGKGYCDALTEDSPGSLCHDHGYEIPVRS